MLITTALRTWLLSANRFKAFPFAPSLSYLPILLIMSPHECPITSWSIQFQRKTHLVLDLLTTHPFFRLWLCLPCSHLHSHQIVLVFLFTGVTYLSTINGPLVTHLMDAAWALRAQYLWSYAGGNHRFATKRPRAEMFSAFQLWFLSISSLQYNACRCIPRKGYFWLGASHLQKAKKNWPDSKLRRPCRSISPISRGCMRSIAKILKDMAGQHRPVFELKCVSTSDSHWTLHPRQQSAQDCSHQLSKNIQAKAHSDLNKSLSYRHTTRLSNFT